MSAFDQMAKTLEEEILRRIKKVEQDLDGQIVEVESFATEEPPPQEEPAPSAFKSRDPVFGGPSAAEFAALTQPPVSPFSQQGRQQGVSMSGAAEQVPEEFKRQAVVEAVVEAVEKEFEDTYFERKG